MWKSLRSIAILQLAIFVALGLFGCSDDIERLQPLQNVEWEEVEGEIYLNGDYLENATAKFEPTEYADTLSLILTGVHPVYDLNFKIGISSNDKGRVEFNGEQRIDNVRIIDATGEYAFIGSKSEETARTAYLKINLNYTVPKSKMTHKSHTVRFEGENGFKFVPPVVKPQGAPEQLIKESLKPICERINREIGNYLKSMAITLNPDGIMVLEYTTRAGETISDDFCYWLKTEEYENGNGIVCPEHFLIEDGDRFYKAILTAITPPGNRNDRLIADLANAHANPHATLVANSKGIISHTLEVAFTDYEFHHLIFQYLRNVLPYDGEWTAEEISALDAMDEYAQEYPMFDDFFSAWCSYVWAFYDNYKF